MHELGIVYQVIRIVDDFSKQNCLTKVDKIVLEVGELSQAVPRFIEECYPAAVNETEYEDTKLEVEVIKAEGRCRNCNEVYGVVEHRRVCPKCNNDQYDLLTGQEFNIKEVVAY